MALEFQTTFAPVAKTHLFPREIVQGCVEQGTNSCHTFATDKKNDHSGKPPGSSSPLVFGENFPKSMTFTFESKKVKIQSPRDTNRTTFN